MKEWRVFNVDESFVRYAGVYRGGENGDLCQASPLGVRKVAARRKGGGGGTAGVISQTTDNQASEAAVDGAVVAHDRILQGGESVVTFGKLQPRLIKKNRPERASLGKREKRDPESG